MSSAAWPHTPPDITVGGKGTRREEEEEAEGDPTVKPKKTLFVCDIFRRDVASFLPRATVQQWRQTSAFSNAALSVCPGRLPRFKYLCLMVIFASADRCRVKRDGFLHHASDDLSMVGTEFRSIFKFRFCCRDDRAADLVGQRLFPGKPDDEGIAFKLWNYRQGEWLKTVVCRAPNLLTRRTAPAMLHFLHHLSEDCFEHVAIEPGPTADPAECVLNPLVLRALPKFRLRGVKLGPIGSGLGKLSALTVRMACAMGVRFNRLFCNEAWEEAPLPQMLNFIATGRSLDKRLELQGHFEPEDIDQIVKHFEREVPSLDGAIRDVRYDRTIGRWELSDWPTRCPRDAAMHVTKRPDEMMEWRFDYTNAHSGEPFSLRLMGHCDEPGIDIRRFELTFASHGQ